MHLAADVAASELIAQIRATASSMKRTPMSSPLDPLTDIIVHGQDTAGYPTANWCYRRGGSKPTIPWPCGCLCGGYRPVLDATLWTGDPELADRRRRLAMA